MYAETGNLHLTVVTCDTSAVVRLDGELDLSTSQLLAAVLEPLLARDSRPHLERLVIDCSQLAFADASGLSPLLHARAVLAARGGGIELRHLPPVGVRVLEVLGLADQLLPAWWPCAERAE